MRLEELYAFQIKRIAKDTGEVLERAVKIGKATNPRLRLRKTISDHEPFGSVDYFVNVDEIWKSSTQGLFWESKLTAKMERALRNKIFKKFPAYCGEGAGKTEMFIVNPTDTTENIRAIIMVCMNEILSVIRLGDKPIVNLNQLDDLFKTGELWIII